MAKNKKIKTFVWSDHHMGHHNALRFDNRPFSSVEQMHRAFIKRHNATVGPDDITYFAGDMGNLTPPELKEIIDKMNGTKILLLGNHDRGVQAMMGAGFDAVMYSATLFIANEIVTISHCPKMGVFREDVSGMVTQTGHNNNWHGEHKNQKFSVPDFGQFHLHGHIHSRPDKPESQKILGRQFDVGVVANNYAPVSMSTIESWIVTTKRMEKRDPFCTGIK